MQGQNNLSLATIVRLGRKCVKWRPAVSCRTSQGDIELSSGTQQDSAPARCLLKGFPSLAAFISSNSNSESFIYKRFDELAARNLLYLQSELAHLQEQLEEFDTLDEQGPCDLEARRCVRSWAEFERAKDSSSKQRERWDLMRTIRETLREYRKQFASLVFALETVEASDIARVEETLIRQSKIAALETPSAKVLEAFNTEFYGHVPCLLGSSKRIYENNDENIQDLVQLHSTERKDRVSTFLAKHMFRLLQTKRCSKQLQFDPRVSYLYTQRLDLLVEVFYAFLSIVLLLGAILSLYFIEQPAWRIGIIILFTLAFAMCAVFLADGRRLAVFGACAAYAAVLVVFVSGNWNSGTSGSQRN